MKTTCRRYKNTINKHITKHNKTNESKLRTMHNKTPKDY